MCAHVQVCCSVSVVKADSNVYKAFSISSQVSRSFFRLEKSEPFESRYIEIQEVEVELASPNIG